MKIKGIIFDFNGVLLWDTPLHDAAWKQVSARLRGWELSGQEMIEKVHGRTNALILEYLAGGPLPQAKLEAWALEKEALYRQMCLDLGENFTLSPGAVELLERLAAQEIPHAIASSSEKNNMAFYLRHLHLTRWFDPAQIIYDDGTLRGKPAPDMYLRAAAALGLPPADCMVVEDAISGIASARAAGIGCIAALGPAERQAELGAQPGVTRVITSLQEVLVELLGVD